VDSVVSVKRHSERVLILRMVFDNGLLMWAGDMNGHVGSSNVGYDGTYGGYGYGARNADGCRILEFTNGLNLVIRNALFMKQKSMLVTYVAVLLNV